MAHTTADLNAKSFWWWQCSESVLDIKIPERPTSPSLISLNGFCGRKAQCLLPSWSSKHQLSHYCPVYTSQLWRVPTLPPPLPRGGKKKRLPENQLTNLITIIWRSIFDHWCRVSHWGHIRVKQIRYVTAETRAASTVHDIRYHVLEKDCEGGKIILRESE